MFSFLKLNCFNSLQLNLSLVNIQVRGIMPILELVQTAIIVTSRIKFRPSNYIVLTFKFRSHLYDTIICKKLINL